MQDQPIMQFKSHVNGKNSDAAIYADRIEWGQEGWMGTGAKLALGAAIGGLSLLKTGMRGKAKGSEMVPIKSVTSVTTAKDGFRHVVKVITSGNTIDFRVGTGEMERVKVLLTELMLGRHGTQSPPSAPAAPATVSGPPAGWYDDPFGSGRKRWWDGSTWTEHYNS